MEDLVPLIAACLRFGLATIVIFLAFKVNYIYSKVYQQHSVSCENVLNDEREHLAAKIETIYEKNCK